MSKLSAALKVFAFFPPLLLLVGTVGVVACGKSIFSTATPTNTSSPTATASPSTMAFVSNFNSGTISEFTRNTTTGKLTKVGVVPAGSAKGPKGMAITPNNSFLYAANFGENKVHEYSIGSGAVLTSIGTVSSGGGPEIIAINPAGTFLWVTNFSNGTITAWSINSTTGALTSVQTVSGLMGPFGLVVNPAGTILYVADNAAGLIYTFTINTSTGALSQNGVPVQNLGTTNGTPGMMTIDPTGSFLYVDDITNGVVSLFNITTGSPVFGAIYPATFTTNQPVGIGVAATSSATYILTANQNAGNVWSFQLSNGGVLNPPIASGSVSSPTGLAVDASDSFAYTADQGDGTVGMFQFNIACPSTIQPVCQIGTVATGGDAPFDVVLTQ